MVLRPAALAALLALGALTSIPGAAAADLVPEAPAAVLLDQTSGRVLFQKQPDLAVPPASLTKLMTLHLTWKALGSGRIHVTDLVPVTAATTGKAVPPGSSLMFLEPGQRVTVQELMLGLAVDSGNDAGLTLAQFLAGSQDAFVAAMNAEATALGLTKTVFFDAFGFDPRNRTTAADFARFSRLYLQQHPQATQVLHNLRDFTYPLPQNQAPGAARTAPPIRQTNRNTLIGTYPGADGLKTGYIEESGYNLAATAQRGPQRLVAVLLGVQGRDTAEGGRLRTAAGVRLLDFGFSSYPLRPLPLPNLRPVRVWFSEVGKTVGRPAGVTLYPLSTDEAAGLSVRQVGPAELEGPLAAGTVVGRLVWSVGGRDLTSLDLVTEGPVGPASWFQQAWEHAELLWRGLRGTAPPQKPVPRTQSGTR